MLQHLAIRNFVIVDFLELDFSSGFGALTGETGAGKSILIDALALVLGERADPGVLRAGADKTEVTATFDIAGLAGVDAWLQEQDLESDGELILRRVLDSSGRSRAYINGSSCTVQQLRAVGEFLVDIHGQHAHQSLLRADAQRALLDGYGGLDSLCREVGAAWKVWRQLETALESAQADSEASVREREMLAWQIQELEQLAFSAREWETLEGEQRRLAHAASLIEGAQYALTSLAEGEGACESQVAAVADRLQDMAIVDPDLEEAAAVLGSIQAELSEVISVLRRYSDRVDLDPARLTAVEQRMDAVLGLARKYRVEPDALPDLLVQWKARLESLQEAADIEALAAKRAEARAVYDVLATRLSGQRQQAAETLGAAVSEQMASLALGTGRLEVGLVPVQGGSAQGFEQVEFRVGGLASTEARPLAKIVSGGELSRISLALQAVTARNASVPTLIFDEVDVGIGGGVAEIVGRLLRQLGVERQVLCVTHLPQVAAQADWHWQVSKSAVSGVVTSSIEVLDATQRVDEVARMLGGVEITETTVNHARELIDNRK
ncbi:MAG: DNA repair protein RecN [Azovibrio sp.]